MHVLIPYDTAAEPSNCCQGERDLLEHGLLKAAAGQRAAARCVKPRAELAVTRDPVLTKTEPERWCSWRAREREPITGGPGAKPLVRGSGGRSPPEAENILKCRQHIFAEKYDENPTI